MGSSVTVLSVETKPQGNTTEPLAVMAVKVSSDAPYARATSTPAGTENKNIHHEHTYTHIKTAHVKSCKSHLLPKSLLLINIKREALYTVPTAITCMHKFTL